MPVSADLGLLADLRAQGYRLMGGRVLSTIIGPAAMLVYMTALAYVAALIVYQVARACGLG